ncbi:fimbrial chaperone protein [Providencia alcalifaciens]|nr:fimbrial chaperone protein [Providencia alcalifaciens]
MMAFWGNETIASGLQVSPVSLTLQGAQNADGIWLSNTGEQSINAQVRVNHWSQSNFKDVLTPSQGLVISPPIIALAPGERQFVRVIRTTPALKDKQDAYRLFINELPPSTLQKSKLHFVLQYSLPIFIQPTNIAETAEKLDWKIQHIDGHIFLDVSNQGTSHAQLSEATYISAAGFRQEISPGLLGYVLPNSTMRWVIPIPASNFTQNSKVEVTVNGQKTVQNL